LPKERRSGSLVPAETFARLYEALDGKRITQPSAGFFKGIDPSAKCRCGAIGCFKRFTEDPRKARAGDD
jgi:hypothetical protein